MSGGGDRILVASHSHPAITKGGGEIAAWRLFEALSERSPERTWFMGCARDGMGRLGSVITQPFSEREFLYNCGNFDWFKFANRDPAYPAALADVLRETRPDILHFHHYMNFGVETFLHIRRVLPDARIVLTLHEFQALCNHYGQMVTRATRSLCHQSVPRDCVRCYPEFSRADFFLRRAYVLRFFALVDMFVSPSHFLAERYVRWGIPEARMRVIENVTAPASADESRVPQDQPGALRVGFFGQISALKGIQVLFDAARILDEEDAGGIQFDIYGDYSGQPEEFQSDFLQRLGRAGHNVHYHGPYENQAVDRLMRGVDVVLLPSIWWENSPVVIEEALRNRQPVICADIGGMAEKIRPGVDGLHFPVGDTVALVALLRGLAREPGKLASLRQTMRRPAAPEATVAKHLDLYAALRAQPAAAA